jgi:hypothetical protein
VLGVTAHFISSDWTLTSVVLAAEHLNESHDHEYLGSVLENLMRKHKLNGKLISCTTDNGANFVKAVTVMKDRNLIQESVRCACHTLQLVVNDALDVEPVKTLVQRANDIINGIRNSQNLHDAYRAAQLSVEGAPDVLLDGVEERPAPRSLRNGRILELLKDVRTRWWSTFRSLSRLLEVKAAVQLTLRDAPGRLGLTDAEWLDVKQVVEVLQPFAAAVRGLEGEKYPTIGMVWQAVWRLGRFLADREITQRDGSTVTLGWRDIKHTANVLRRELHSNLQGQKRFRFATQVMQVATVLDPRYKDLRFLPADLREGVYRTVLATHVNDGCRKHHAELNGDAPAAPAFADDVILEPLAAELDDDLPGPADLDAAEAAAGPAPLRRADGGGPRDWLFDLPQSSEQPHLGCAFWQQLMEYVRMPVRSGTEADALFMDGDAIDPLRWWKHREAQFPLVAALARRYLCIPASSAPSERLFSHMNITQDKHRVRLSIDRVERLLFLKLNETVLQRLQSWHALLRD